jgi:hypothetical protein
VSPEIGKVLARFKGCDCREANNTLGLRIDRDRAKRMLVLSQPELIDATLRRFGMVDTSSRVSPWGSGPILVLEGDRAFLPDDAKQLYQQIAGCLLYVTGSTRPDLTYAATQRARFMAAPRVSHLKEAKKALRYLNATKSRRLWLGCREGESNAWWERFDACISSDADFAMCTGTGRMLRFHVAWCHKSCSIR